jgi:hypothetical protein
MSERGVSDVVAEGDRIDKVFIESKQSPNGSGNFGDELNMENPMGDVIVPDEIEYLGLVNIAAIGERVKNPVPIQGKILPVSGDDLFLRLSPDGPVAGTGP